jgi:hypothetical protein
MISLSVKLKEKFYKQLCSVAEVDKLCLLDFMQSLKWYLSSEVYFYLFIYFGSTGA